MVGRRSCSTQLYFARVGAGKARAPARLLLRVAAEPESDTTAAALSTN
jgi:hypothetical protein